MKDIGTTDFLHIAHPTLTVWATVRDRGPRVPTALCGCVSTLSPGWLLFQSSPRSLSNLQQHGIPRLIGHGYLRVRAEQLCSLLGARCAAAMQSAPPESHHARTIRLLVHTGYQLHLSALTASSLQLIFSSQKWMPN